MIKVRVDECIQLTKGADLVLSIIKHSRILSHPIWRLTLITKAVGFVIISVKLKFCILLVWQVNTCSLTIIINCKNL